MGEDQQRDERPLRSEALKRDEWRGDATVVQDAETTGHTPPASESDAGAGEGRAEGPRPLSGTMLPPD